MALLKSLNEKIVAAVTISPADLVVLLYEIAGENASFGSGLAQRAHIAAQSQPSVVRFGREFSSFLGIG